MLSSDPISFHSVLLLYYCRNKMVEYLTDWVMGTSNQAADDDIKCLTRCTSVTCTQIHCKELRERLLHCVCVCVLHAMQRPGPGQYGGSGVSVSWPSSAARGGGRSRADGGQISALPQVRTHLHTFYPECILIRVHCYFKWFGDENGSSAQSLASCALVAIQSRTMFGFFHQMLRHVEETLCSVKK